MIIVFCGNSACAFQACPDVVSFQTWIPVQQCVRRVSRCQFCKHMPDSKTHAADNWFAAADFPAGNYSLEQSGFMGHAAFQM